MLLRIGVRKVFLVLLDSTESLRVATTFCLAAVGFVYPYGIRFMESFSWMVNRVGFQSGSLPGLTSRRIRAALARCPNGSSPLMPSGRPPLSAWTSTLCRR
jgi:hypothetical protein